jgi:hypothetical protein
MACFRLLGCVLGIVIAVGLSQAQPPGDLTASFAEGSTKSSASLVMGAWTVTDTVTNTSNKNWGFKWDAENKSPFQSQAAMNGGTATQTWNTAANTVTGSTKGGISLIDLAGGTTFASYTAQKWIPPQPPGGGGLQSRRKFGLFGRSHVAAEAPPLFPLEVGEAPLFCEFAVDNKPLLRVESRAIDLTGEGDYVLAAVAYNGTNGRLWFRSEDGVELAVPPGRSAVQWYDGGAAWDAMFERYNVWEVTAEVGADRFETFTIGGHLWMVAR